MLGVALALSASLLWGSADFLGGQAGRRVSVLGVAFVSQLVGLVAVGVALLARGHPDPAAIWWGVAAGVIGVGSVPAFYRALALGTMSVVAPIAATSAVVPVLVGVALGDRMAPVAAVGIVAALVGVVLASRSPSGGAAIDHRRSVVLAVVAAALLGLQLVFLGGAGRADALTGVVASRVASVAVFALVALAVRPRVGRPDLPALAAIGLADTGANLVYALATAQGLLSLVSVLGSLYPVVTVALAYARLGERLSRLQGVGVVVALVGVGLIAGGWG